MNFLKSEGEMLSILCQKDDINRHPGRRNPGCRMGESPCRTGPEPGSSERWPCTPAPRRGQEESRGQGRSEWREERQTHRLWRYIPASGSHCSRRGTRLQRHAERKMGWGGVVGALFYFWILPNQKNWGNYENCCAETQPLPGWFRPVYK